jgi:hypothetical protein
MASRQEEGNRTRPWHLDNGSTATHLPPTSCPLLLCHAVIHPLFTKARTQRKMQLQLSNNKPGAAVPLIPMTTTTIKGMKLIVVNQ